VGDFDVILYGTDTSGRGVYMTKFMRAWWLRVADELGFEPTIVQGAFMTRAGGGAGASAGYHDKAGCLDLRTWDRTAEQQEQMVRVLRRMGAAAWRRDQRHGMDPHIHFVLGADQPLDDGAAYQWRQYLDGRDGLAGNGPDYEWRPSPLVTTPPEDDMPYTEKQLTGMMRAAVAAELAPLNERLEQLDDEHKVLIRKLFANLRVILKERFGATDKDLDEILGHLER